MAKKIMSVYKIIIAFLSIFVLSSCAVKEKRGYYFFDKNKVENFDVYNFTKQDVLDNIGLPSVELDRNVWLYYSYSTENYRFLRPKLKEENILIVYFDENNNIKDFSLLTKKDTNELLKIKDTSIVQEKKNILKQLFEGLMFTPAM